MAEEVVHAVTVSLEKNYEFTASFERFPDVEPILLDEPPPLGEGHGPNAAALLAAAVGNCLAASLAFSLRKSHADVKGLKAVVRARVARNEKGRTRISGMEVELTPALADADLTKLARCSELFEDFCVVTASVRQGIPVAVTVKNPDE
jgi:uncharacterized OsmC-like protein